MSVITCRRPLSSEIIKDVGMGYKLQDFIPALLINMVTSSVVSCLNFLI